MERDKKQIALDIALTFAAQEGSTRIVRELLDAGANIHVGEDQPLLWAAENGRTATVEFLLAAGSDPQGDRALRHAAQNGHMETVRALFEWADRHKPGSGDTPSPAP